MIHSRLYGGYVRFQILRRTELRCHFNALPTHQELARPTRHRPWLVVEEHFACLCIMERNCRMNIDHAK